MLPDSPGAALQRYWLQKTEPGDAQILRTFLAETRRDTRLLKTSVPGFLVDEGPVRSVAGVGAGMACTGVMAALYPEGAPRFAYAAAMALDAIEGTPDLNADAIPEDCRFEDDDEDGFED